MVDKEIPNKTHQVAYEWIWQHSDDGFIFCRLSSDICYSQDKCVSPFHEFRYSKNGIMIRTTQYKLQKRRNVRSWSSVWYVPKKFQVQINIMSIVLEAGFWGVIAGHWQEF